jgi:hypothetical protein
MLKIKLTDFGLSRDANLYSTSQSGIKPIAWSALESLRFDQFSKESDIW